jgi:hypothetical protein
VEARHGPALSSQERRVLTDIEQVLRTDEELDLALRSMRFRRLRWLHKRHHGRGPDGVGGEGSGNSGAT